MRLLDIFQSLVKMKCSVWVYYDDIGLSERGDILSEEELL